MRRHPPRRNSSGVTISRWRGRLQVDLPRRTAAHRKANGKARKASSMPMSGGLLQEELGLGPRLTPTPLRSSGEVGYRWRKKNNNPIQRKGPAPEKLPRGFSRPAGQLPAKRLRCPTLNIIVRRFDRACSRFPAWPGLARPESRRRTAIRLVPSVAGR